MDKQEFNEAIARLNGYTKLTSVDPERFSKGDCYYEWVGAPDYYSDLNMLMPLAWKYQIVTDTVIKMLSDDSGGYISDYEWKAFCRIRPKYDASWQNKDPIEAIRQCLWSISESENDT